MSDPFASPPPLLSADGMSMSVQTPSKMEIHVQDEPPQKKQKVEVSEPGLINDPPVKADPVVNAPIRDKRNTRDQAHARGKSNTRRKPNTTDKPDKRDKGNSRRKRKSRAKPTTKDTPTTPKTTGIPITTDKAAVQAKAPTTSNGSIFAKFLGDNDDVVDDLLTIDMTEEEKQAAAATVTQPEASAPAAPAAPRRLTEEEREAKRQRKAHYRKQAQEQAIRRAEAEKNRPACVFWTKGRCTKGDTCPFPHTGTIIKNAEVCSFFQSNSCLKGDACTFSHDLRTVPCKFFHTSGLCKRMRDCPYSHQRLTLDGYKAFVTENWLALEETLQKIGRTNIQFPPDPALGITRPGVSSVKEGGPFPTMPSGDLTQPTDSVSTEEGTNEENLFSTTSSLPVFL